MRTFDGWLELRNKVFIQNNDPEWIEFLRSSYDEQTGHFETVRIKPEFLEIMPKNYRDRLSGDLYALRDQPDSFGEPWSFWGIIHKETGFVKPSNVSIDFLDIIKY